MFRVSTSMDEFESNFSFSEDEALKALQASRNRKSYDRTICSCGHPSVHHGPFQNQMSCSFMNKYCPCRSLLPVIEAEDLRFFQKTTNGEGANHALALGITSSIRSKKKIQWVVKPVCMNCKSETERIRPVPLTLNNERTYKLGQQTVLACYNCLPWFSNRRVFVLRSDFTNVTNVTDVTDLVC